MAAEPAPLPGLILASASPRRRELLAQTGLAFEVVPAAIDETPRTGEAAAHYVARMAREKAQAVARRFPESAVLGADTSVVLDEVILGKPDSAQAAQAMLESLSGRCHQVMTAVALVRRGSDTQCRLSCTEVEFAALSRAWIEAYIDSGDPVDKAGAYGIQNAAGLKIRRIRGSYSGVVGLPLFDTARLLEAAGLLMPA